MANTKKGLAKKRILITGGTGFLGIHLARYFIKNKFKVRLLDIAPLSAKDLEGKIEFVRCDIRNSKDVNKSMDDVDYVIHAAAALPIHHDRDYIFDVNVNGTKNVLESALHNKIKKYSLIVFYKI